MRKMMKGIAAILAVSALMAGSAFAGNDKLAVKAADGVTSVFSVQDDGNIVGNGNLLKFDGTTKKFLLGPQIATPIGTLEIRENGINADRGIVVGQHNDGPQAAPINFYKSRGTAVAPTQPIAGDYIGAFAGLFWNGTAYDRAAQFGFKNDGAVTAGSFPTAIIFWAGDKSANMKEALRINSSNNVVVGNLGGSATVDMATTATNGFLYIPTVAGALTTCASVTAFAGHVPVWFDTTNSKICTCQGVTLKCTAALL